MRDTTRFVAACCRWPVDAAAHEAVAAAAADVGSWELAQEAVAEHRVVALVHPAVRDLACVPQAFRDWARQEAHGVALQAMELTRTCIDVDKALKAAGVSPLHLKGPVLGQLAYNSVVRKFSRDLDIFVPPSEANAAIAALEGLGYRRAGQGDEVSARLADAVIRNCKDLKFGGPSGTLIELHWRLCDIGEDLSGAERDPKAQTIAVAGTTDMQTMAAEQLVPYLCQHGAAHFWTRLKWLADLSAYLNALPALTRARVIAEVGTGPASDVLAQALALCDTLFGTEYAPRMSRRARILYRYALARIDQPRVAPTSARGVIRQIKDIIASRHLHATPWAGVWALRGHLIGQEDVMALPLPPSLDGVYIVIRLPSLIVRRLKGLVPRRGASAKHQT
ncbi:nucleotidyltransferase family protein [Rhodobacteraceae bacterium N5(2021)]|uniref:Nucleotidyltransferase family protein n=1 Tax=Gymnodinialimonas phycosphaerae TaxID=2841589 RepID=A0A975YGJ2_9RHOB|nr:nucleotidyltransferase family protein [Gymnodinialimonas phycosphaerae]MBY4891631.1 nucleotidyltransferase family protein [Gymnodinialimonas phycosphaerae]